MLENHEAKTAEQTLGSCTATPKNDEDQLVQRRQEKRDAQASDELLELLCQNHPHEIAKPEIKPEPVAAPAPPASSRDLRAERIKQLNAKIAEISAELELLQVPLEPRPPTVEGIISAVAQRFNVTKNDLKSIRRDHPMVFYRQRAMYLAKLLTRQSLPEIGRRFGGRDHTTVLHAVRKVTSDRRNDPALDRELREIEASIKPRYFAPVV